MCESKADGGRRCTDKRVRTIRDQAKKVKERRRREPKDVECPYCEAGIRRWYETDEDNNGAEVFHQELCTNCGGGGYLQPYVAQFEGRTVPAEGEENTGANLLERQWLVKQWLARQILPALDGDTSLSAAEAAAHPRTCELIADETRALAAEVERLFTGLYVNRAIKEAEYADAEEKRAVKRGQREIEALVAECLDRASACEEQAEWARGGSTKPGAETEPAAPEPSPESLLAEKAAAQEQADRLLAEVEEHWRADHADPVECDRAADRARVVAERAQAVLAAVTASDEAASVVDWFSTEEMRAALEQDGRAHAALDRTVGVIAQRAADVREHAEEVRRFTPEPSTSGTSGRCPGGCEDGWVPVIDGDIVTGRAKCFTCGGTRRAAS